MYSDPILRQVHWMKDSLARKVGYDVEQLFDRLRKAAEQHPERMVKPLPKATKQARRRNKTPKPAK